MNKKQKEKAAQKFLRKVVKNCRNGVLHPQTEYNLLNELVNLLMSHDSACSRLAESRGDSSESDKTAIQQRNP